MWQPLLVTGIMYIALRAVISSLRLPTSLTGPLTGTDHSNTDKTNTDNTNQTLENTGVKMVSRLSLPKTWHADSLRLNKVVRTPTRPRIFSRTGVPMWMASTLHTLAAPLVRRTGSRFTVMASLLLTDSSLAKLGRAQMVSSSFKSCRKAASSFVSSNIRKNQLLLRSDVMSRPARTVSNTRSEPM